MISTNQLKSGNHIEVDGTVYRVLEFQHVNPGKGAAFVRTKLRRASDGNVIDKTLPGRREAPGRAHGVASGCSFSTPMGRQPISWTRTRSSRSTLPEEELQDSLRWIKASDEVDILFIDEEPSDVQVPSAVDLEVTQTDPGVRGDTASGGGSKPATLETGVVVQVPLFISEGQRVRVDTREGKYLSRA